MKLNFMIKERHYSINGGYYIFIGRRDYMEKQSATVRECPNGTV